MLRKRIELYCAYQERCQQEVRNKLYDLGGYSREVEQLIGDMITQGFLNEERFAIAWAGGKFRIKQWGRVKIIGGLKQKQISPYCIKKALEQIDEDDYWNTLLQILSKKDKQYQKAGPAKKQSLARFAMSKGFESNLVWKALNEGK